jgi:hypothetical protein
MCKLKLTKTLENIIIIWTFALLTDNTARYEKQVNQMIEQLHTALAFK